APRLLPMPCRIECPAFMKRQRKHNQRAGKMSKSGHRQSVVLSRNTFSKDPVNGKAQGTRHRNRVAFDGCRMRGNAVFGSEHSDSRKCAEHSNGLMSSGPLKPEKNRQHENVDRAQTDDHRGMAYAGEMQANREAHLIYRHAKETKVNKGPEIACNEASPPQFGRFHKSL